MGHSYIGTEHLLLGLVRVDDGPTAQLFASIGLTFESLATVIIEALGTGEPTDMVQSPFTPGAKKVLEMSLREALQMGHNNIGSEHIFLGMLRDPESEVGRILTQHFSADLIALRATLINLMATADETNEAVGTARPGATPTTRAGNASMLEQYAHNLTAAAAANELDPVIGRYSEIERVIQVLVRRTKNNPVLIGEPGVGKTAVVEGLAQAIAAGMVPKQLTGKQVYSLDLGQMVAGTRYRGDFEERLKRVLAEATKRGDVILFLDEMHTVIGAGAAEGSIDAANILKPLLARGQMQTVGATTLDEYRKYIEKDAALERRFQPITVDPPSVEETVEILRGLRSRYEEHHDVLITDDALGAAASLADRYVTDRFLPDKAIDLLDEAGSRLQIRGAVSDDVITGLAGQLRTIRADAGVARTEDRLADAASLAQHEVDLRAQLDLVVSDASVRHGNIVDAEVIAEVLSSWTKIPLVTVNADEASRLLLLEGEMHQRVVGQDAAVTALSRAVRRSRAGLKDEKRPAGSFIFLGPSGVGKTELAKSLAECVLGDETALISLDMSDFMEKHSVSRLVGSPPGYVGYEEAGQLTEAVRRKPFSVVLFDEIEKAHPDVFNLLLQILEEGRLTDSQGRVVEFANTFIVMTSNLGTTEIAKGKMGFATTSATAKAAARSETAFKALKDHFRPEFLNRIDEVIVFDALTTGDITQIVDLMLTRTRTRLSALGLGLELTPAAKQLLATKGYDPELGARPLRRAIQRFVEDPMSEQILLHQMLAGDIILADVAAAGDELVFTSNFTSAPPLASASEGAIEAA